MANFTKTEPYVFAQFCTTFEKFSIPNFQRPYAWTNKNIQDFWSSVVSNEKEYFIGNIVAVDNKPLQIIDGQQRITTISLLLVAIRDSYLELKLRDPKDKQKVKQKEQLINRYLCDEDLSIVPAEKYRRLTLGKDIFQKVYDKLLDKKVEEIKLEELGDNQKRLISNYKTLKSLISKHIEGSELSRLDEVLDKTLSLQFIVIICSTENDIYNIFEGFNSTGLGLSVSDLVKNSILKGTNDDVQIQRNIEEQWNELEMLFEETSVSKFPKFLRHQWISTQGYESMSGLYRVIKKDRVDDKSPEDIKNYVEGILIDGKIYVGMQYDKYTKYLDLPEDIIKELVKFRFLRNEQVYEVLLCYYKIFKLGNIKPSALKKMICRLWIFIVRAKFVSISPSEYERIFASYCKDLCEAKSTEEIAKESDIFFAKLKKLSSSKKQFIENFISDVKYGTDNKLIKTAFVELMQADNPEISTNKPEIEHILPQEPIEWKLTKTEIKDSVNKLGNLTLLFSDFNKENSNKTMDFKRKVFKKSQFKLNQEIESKWSDDFDVNFSKAIALRGEELVTRLEKIWSL